MVERGRNAQGRHEHPWVYNLKVKSGRNRTQNVQMAAYNLADLWGQIIEDRARSGEDLFAWNIRRIMRKQYRSRRDY